MPDTDTEVVDNAGEQQPQQPAVPLFPSEGGSYTRDPVTGALTKQEQE